jgi:hypothetical protein
MVDEQQVFQGSWIVAVLPFTKPLKLHSILLPSITNSLEFTGKDPKDSVCDGVYHCSHCWKIQSSNE